MFAVTVSFRIHEGQQDAFLPLMIENARKSKSDEPGCLQFDVCRDEGGIFLYEIYKDRAAFDQHLESSHFKAFDKATVDMVAEKHVRLFSDVFQ